MKIESYLNLIFYLFTLSLYLYEIIYGALIQIVLGIIQIVIAISINSNIKKLNNYSIKLLNIYWILIGLWLSTTILIKAIFGLQNVFIPLLLVTPMIIGTYFTIVLFKIQKV